VTPTVVGGRRSLLSEICAQSDPPQAIDVVYILPLSLQKVAKKAIF